jgi:hypothetical protein
MFRTASFNLFVLIVCAFSAYQGYVAGYMFIASLMGFFAVVNYFLFCYNIIQRRV